MSKLFVVAALVSIASTVANVSGVGVDWESTGLSGVVGQAMGFDFLSF